MAQFTGKIRVIEDNNDSSPVFPLTHTKAVKNNDGEDIEKLLSQKQDALVSGATIKSINNKSLLGSGNFNLLSEINVDANPTRSSNNPVSSGGTFTALEGKVSSNDIDNIVEVTKGQFNDIQTKNPDTIYIVTDDQEEGDGYVSIADISTVESEVAGGENVTTILLSNGNIHNITTINGLRGPQGNSGYTGAVGELEVVNNDRDGGETSAWSAERGKTIRDDVDGIRKNYKSGYLTSAALHTSSSSAIVTDFIPVVGGDTIVWYHGFTSTQGSYCICGYNAAKEPSGNYWSCNTTTSRTITVSAENTTIAYVRATMSATAETVYVSVNGEKLWEKKELSNGVKQDIEEINSIQKYVGLETEITKVQIYNGTEVNSGNATLVRTARISVLPGHTYRLNLPRPVVAGNYNFFGYAIYSSTSGSISENRTRTKDITATPYLTNPTVTIRNTGEVALLFTIGENDSNNDRVTLREHNFIDYDVSIDDVTALVNPRYVLDKGVDVIKSMNLSSDWQRVELAFGRLGTGEGSFPSETSSSICLTAPIQAKRGDIFTGTWDMRGRGSQGSAVYKTNSTNTVGISPLVQVASNGRQTIEFSVEEDCYITLQINGTSLGDAELFVKHTNVAEIPGHSLKTDTYLYQEQTGYHRVLNWKNGSYANKASANFIHCEAYDIPAGASSLIFKTTRPVDEGHEYRLAYRWLTDGGSSVSPADSSESTVITNPITVPSNATRFYLSLRQYNISADEDIDLRYTDMAGYESWICTYDPGSLAYMQDKSRNENSIVTLNMDRRMYLAAMSRQNKRTTSPYHDYQLLITTDEHNDTISGERAVDAVNGFYTINAYANCGDITNSYYRLSEVAAFQERFSKLTKPGYVVIGNHDVGNTYYVGVCATHEQAYEAYIKPMVDAGYLVEGEYAENTPYWFHDNTTYKVRIIGLYEYESPLDIQSSAYWEPIEYNSEYPKMTYSTAYSVDDCINCGNHLAHSFRCKAPVTTSTNYYTDVQYLPTFKCHRGKRYIGETQANWFLNTLGSTPADYGVIVMMHQPISNDARIVESKFTQAGVSATNVQTMMQTDFIIEAITAFANGTRYQQNIVFNNEAEYKNTQSGDDGMYAYSVDKDFSQKNSGTYVMGVISGHRHRDIVYEMNGIYQINAVCATTDRTQATGSDIRRTIDTTLCRDSLTVVSFAQGRIGLCKLGVNVTLDGTPRDYEVINTTQNS